MSRETLRARLADATPGPWTADDDPELTCDSVWANDGDMVASTYGSAAKGSSDMADSALIAHARQDLPALLALADAVADMFATRYTTWSGNGDESPADAQWLHDPTEVRKALAALEELP